MGAPAIQPEGVVRHAADALISVDAEHRIVSMNPVAEALTGVSEAEAGKKIGVLESIRDILHVLSLIAEREAAVARAPCRSARTATWWGPPGTWINGCTIRVPVSPCAPEVGAPLARLTSLRGGYQFTRLRRDHFEVERTRTSRVFASFSSRSWKPWSGRMRYSLEHTTDLFMHGLARFMTACTSAGVEGGLSYVF